MRVRKAKRIMSSKITAECSHMIILKKNRGGVYTNNIPKPMITVKTKIIKMQVK